jgi:hypothetical protein
MRINNREKIIKKKKNVFKIMGTFSMEKKPKNKFN